MGKKVNRSELSEYCDVHITTISAWIRRGCPYDQKGAKGKEWVFDTADVLAWREGQAVINAAGDIANIDETELKRRKLAAETTVSEINATRARSEVVYVEDARLIVEADYAVIRARMAAIGSRITPLVVAETDVLVIRREIDREIDSALSELSCRFIEAVA